MPCVLEGSAGFEPTLAEPNSAVLPLNELPIKPNAPNFSAWGLAVASKEYQPFHHQYAESRRIRQANSGESNLVRADAAADIAAVAQRLPILMHVSQEWTGVWRLCWIHGALSAKLRAEVGRCRSFNRHDAPSLRELRSRQVPPFARSRTVCSAFRSAFHRRRAMAIATRALAVPRIAPFHCHGNFAAHA